MTISIEPYPHYFHRWVMTLMIVSSLSALIHDHQRWIIAVSALDQEYQPTFDIDPRHIFPDMAHRGTTRDVFGRRSCDRHEPGGVLVSRQR